MDRILVKLSMLFPEEKRVAFMDQVVSAVLSKGILYIVYGQFSC
jgi:hypothetical protein